MKNPLLFLVALAGLASCSKHNDPQATPDQPALSRTELLTASPWQLTAQRDIITPRSGGAAVTKNYTVVPGSVKVFYKTDGSVSVNYPFQQGNPTSGGNHTLADSLLWSNISGSNGIIRELTAYRMVLMHNLQGFNELTQHAETFTH